MKKMKKRKKNFSILCDDALCNILSYILFYFIRKKKIRLTSRQFNRAINKLENKIINCDLKNLKKTNLSTYYRILSITQYQCSCIVPLIYTLTKISCFHCNGITCFDCSKECAVCKRKFCYSCYNENRIKMCYSCKIFFCYMDSKNYVRDCISCRKSFCEKCLISLPPFLKEKCVCNLCKKKISLINVL